MDTLRLAIVFKDIINDWDEKIFDYLEDKWNDYLRKSAGVRIKISVFHEKSDEKVKLKVFLKNKDGKPVYGTENGKKLTRSIITEEMMGEYHIVMFAYNAEKTATWPSLYSENGRNLGKGNVTSFSFRNELYIDTEYTELEMNNRPSEGLKKTQTSALHEVMHALCKRAQRDGYNGVVDHMDKTVVKGKKTTYYKNSKPFAKDGNYERTLKSLNENDAWDSILDMRRYKLFAALKKIATNKKETPKIIKNTMTKPITDYKSPNYSKRSDGSPIITQKKAFMLHSTAGSFEGAVEWLCTSPEERLRVHGKKTYSSAHVVIDRDGTIAELIHPMYRAWHGGGVDRRTKRAIDIIGQDSPNDLCIGVEFANYYDHNKDGMTDSSERVITNEQIDAFRDYAAKYEMNINKNTILTHFDTNSNKPNMELSYNAILGSKEQNESKIDVKGELLKIRDDINQLLLQI